MRARRLTLELSAVDVEQQGGPSSKSVLKHERGRIQRIDLLTKHMRVLQLVLTDVLRFACGDRAAVSEDALHVAQIFDRLPDAGRDLLWKLALTLDAPHRPDAPSRARR